MIRRPGDAMLLAPGEEEEILAMIVAGKSYDEIIDWIGCSYGQVKRIACRHGHGRKGASSALSLAIVEHKRQGYSTEAVRERLKVSRHQIAGAVRRAKANGLL